jgi:RsiW-degrading membrane proteinase PrsW (M82 family)
LSDVTYVLKNQSYVQNGGSLTLLCRFTANQAKIEKNPIYSTLLEKEFFRIPNLQPEPSWTVLMSFASGYFFSVPYLIIYFHI